MADIEKVISILSAYKNHSFGDKAEKVTVEEIIALLKEQEPEAMDAPKPDSDIGCWYDITHNYTLEQVVSALKEQKPRLVTEADFENADEYGFIPAWYEGLVNKEGWWNCIPKEALETAKEDGCRYWTSKPSLKQMEETPWP